MTMHNAKRTCWNCPAAKFEGNVDFRGCGQSSERIRSMSEDGQLVIECHRRPELGHFEPSITFEECTEWVESPYGYMLKDMRVLILGMDGYLGWTLALKLGVLGYKVSGVDNFWRRDMVAEKEAHSVVPIYPIEERLEAAKEVLDLDLNFKEMDIMDRAKLKPFLEKVKPEAIVHYAECPSAPYSMVDVDHASKVIENNVIGTLGLLFTMRDTCPTASLIKLGTMGEYGAPLTGRPLFEGIFPGDAVLKWGEREWSLGGEITPRDPVSFYHVSKVQDTFTVYEACKYWWLRSYDVMQGVIYGVHTEEVSKDKRLRTRLDIDEWFGTVMNRFVAQAVLGMPLTVYGEGEQIRGFIALEDAMECMCRLINTPPEPGQYDVVNQVSGLHKVGWIAETVAKVGKAYERKVRIQRVENPRVEADKHPLEAISTKLPGQMGFMPKVDPETAIDRMFELLTQPHVEQRILNIKEAVFPQTRWSGKKGKMDVLEVYDAGTKKEEEETYKGRLET
jgi:UDP-sulfoquinovose synthase